MKNDVISVEVDSEILKKATDILNNLGIDIDTYINMALVELIKKNGIPFDIEISEEIKH